MFGSMRYYALVSCLVHSALSQGPTQLTFSSNPVYSQDAVTVTCSWVSGATLVDVTIEAFDAALWKGSVSCRSSSITCTAGSGVFNGTSVSGWPIPVGATSVSMNLIATPSLELNYNCTVRIVYGSALYKVTSASVFLQVRVCPSPPKFQPIPFVYNDSDSGIIICESRSGKPAANISLTVNDTSGGVSIIEIGSDWASVNLPLPLSKWHNAVATCSVTNHKCSYMSIWDNLRINHIINNSVPGVIDRNESVMLNCSTYISYYPGVLYNWTVPPAVNVTGSPYLERITVPPGQSGLFYCTATNNVTMASVLIVFTVSNSSRPVTTTPLPSSGCEKCWIIGVVLGIIAVVVIAVVLGVLYKRGHFSKGRTSIPGSQRHHPEVCVTEEINVANLRSLDREYDSLDTQRSNEPIYSKLVLEQNCNSTTLYENFQSSNHQD